MKAWERFRMIGKVEADWLKFYGSKTRKKQQKNKAKQEIGEYLLI